MTQLFPKSYSLFQQMSVNEYSEGDGWCIKGNFMCLRLGKGKLRSNVQSGDFTDFLREICAFMFFLINEEV